MANESRRLDVSEFDFDDVKTNLKTFLKSQSQFKDYDFEGSGISALLDVLAYNTHYLGYNMNMLANEMFLDTSTLRSSIVSHAKTLGYEVTSSKASYADVNVVLNSAKSSATMPAGTVFTTTIDNIDYQFVTVEELTRQNTGANIPFNNIKIYEGSYITSRYTVDSNDVQQRFVMPEAASDTSTLTVEVQNSASDTSTTSFTKAVDISALSSKSNVYFLQEVEAGKFEVYFGDGVVSKSLTNGNIVLLKYVVTNRSAANGASVFASSGAVDTVTDITVTTVNKAIGGSGPESLTSIKINAPLDYASQGRCVTAEDYKVYAKKLFPQTQAVMVFGGDVGSYDPSLGVTGTASYGRVYISIKSTTGNNLTDAQKSLLVSDLKKYNVASITPVIIDPEITYIILNTNFKYDSSKTTKTKEDLISDVSTTLRNYNNSNLKSFNIVFRHSAVGRLIDDTNDSILSNITNVTLAKFFTPASADQVTKYNLYFNNALYNPHPGHAKSAGGIISSSGFKVGSETTESFFDEDGSGNLRRFHLVGIVKTYDNNAAGTVNYTTGQISINGITISSISDVDGLTSGKIRLTAIPSSKDIVPVRNQILELDVVNIKVSGDPDSIAVGDAGASTTYTTSTSYASNTSY